MATNVIGKRLQKYRIELGLTQEQATAKCQRIGLDITRGTYAKIESCVRGVTDIEVELLSKVLRVSPGDLFPAKRRRK